MNLPPFDIADVALLILYPMIALALGWLLASAAGLFLKRSRRREAQRAHASSPSRRRTAPREVHLLSDLTIS